MFDQAIISTRLYVFSLSHLVSSNHNTQQNQLDHKTVDFSVWNSPRDMRIAKRAHSRGEKNRKRGISRGNFSFENVRAQPYDRTNTNSDQTYADYLHFMTKAWFWK